MRARLLPLRRSAATIPGIGLREFEFAHLLDIMAHIAVDAAVDVPVAVPDIEPDVAVVDSPDIPLAPAPSDRESDLVPEVVPEIVISRFADSGLDDDRLPVAVKRRRGRRR